MSFGIALSALIGGNMLGVVGALLAVPTAAILQVLVMEILDMRDPRMRSPEHDRQPGQVHHSVGAT